MLIRPVMASDAKKTQMLRVSPIVLPITIDPGAEHTYNLILTNLLPSPLPVRLTVEGYETTDEEGGIKTDTNVSTPLADWITLKSSDIILPANASQDIPVTVRVPSTVAVGGYYATIMMTPLLPQPQDSAPVVVPKIGVVVLAGIGVQAETKATDIDIPTFAFASSVFEGNPLTGIVRVKNTALSHRTVKPILEFTPFIGGETYRADLPDKVILPGKIRRWDVRTSIPGPHKGLYLVTARVSVGGGEMASKELWLVVFPWRTALTVFIAVAVVILTMRYRKRITKALTAIAGK